MTFQRTRLHRHDGFSLMEVAIATGICSWVLIAILSLLPVGILAIHNASMRVTETEIFNRQWAQFNTTTFYNLQNANNGLSPLFPSPNSSLCYYYDVDGQDITPTGPNPTPPFGTVYTTRCFLVNSQTDPGLAATVPVVDGGTATSGPSLTFIRIQIGFHFDPANLLPNQTDPRVATRTFLIAKRDTWNGS